MAGNNGLIRRIDSLINAEAGAADSDRREGSRALRRRRSFLASPAPTDAAARVADTPQPFGDDDDLPLLTDVVLPAELAPLESLETISARLRQALAATIEQLVEQHLRTELPALVDAALEHAADQLQRSLGAAVDAALRDSLAPAAPTPPGHADPGGSRKAPSE